MRAYFKLICVIVVLFFQGINAKGADDEFVDISKYLPENILSGSKTDATQILQNLINKYDKVLMPNSPIYINFKGININSNKHIVFQEQSQLIMLENDKSNYQLLKIENSNNIKLTNARLIGDSQNHLGTSGEWGMGIKIDGGENIIIENAVIENCWGDGIYINRGKTNSKNIEIKNSIIKKARRNGITIISGENLIIDNVEILEIAGKLPMAGIDIEPNSNIDVIGRILISNVKTRGCNIGVQLGLRHYPSEKIREMNVSINNFQSNSDNHGLLIGDLFRAKKYGSKIKPLEGFIKFSHISISNSKKEPIKVYSQNGYQYSPKIIFEAVRLSEKRSIQLNIKDQLDKRGFETLHF